MGITVSNPNNIASTSGNSLAVFKDAVTNQFYVKDINGQLESLEQTLGQESLQDVLDVNNTATQDINLIGSITTTNIYITALLKDKNNSSGTAGQLLSSTGTGTQWITAIVPNLQNVLDLGNTATQSITLTGTISTTNLSIGALLRDSTLNSGGAGQILSSTGTATLWTTPILSSLTTIGSSGSSTLIGGVLNVPTYTLSGLGGVPTSRTLTINGVTYDLSADRTWSIADTGITSLNSLTALSQFFAVGTSGTDFNISSVSDTHTFNLPTASATNRGALSSADWSTFSGKQNAITLTTTGASGSSTFIGGTLNVPTYTISGLGGVPTSRTLTINGTAYDLSADRTWSVGTITSVTASSPIFSSGGNTPDISIQVANGTQNGYLSSTDWNTFNNKQNTLSLTTLGASGASTLIGSTLNVPEYTISGLGGVPTSRTLTINGTAYDLSADRTWSVGTLSSVGLTMPSAFSVANTPLTANGTLAVTAIGTVAQYIRGDGQLATLPASGGGGGSSVFYYLNGSIASTVPTYEQMSRTAVIGSGTDFTIDANGLIAQFLTDVADPNEVEIPSGAWNFEMFFNASSAGGTPAFYVDLLKYDGSTFTLISSGSTNPENITGGTTVDLYLTSLAVPLTSLLVTDRLAIRVYIVNSVAGRTITLHTEDNNLCQITTTFASGISSINGLTKNTQYLTTTTTGTDFTISQSGTDTHTFNLPTASAVNRGALSSADWTTFNNKTNIYLSDGTLAGNRTVTMNSYTLSFTRDLLVNGLTIGVGLGNIASNTAIGASSLFSNTSGNSNTSVGNSTLYSNTTGYYNTSLGYQSLYTNTSGAENVCIGYQSGYSNTTALQNTFLGNSSGYFTSTGGLNTFIGTNAGYNNTTGTQNTNLGRSSALNNTTGSQNLILGYQAGRYIADGMGSASVIDNSVLLGHNSRVSASGETNQIVIGYLAIGNGSNTAQIGNSSITNLKTFGTITAGAITYPNVDGTSGQYLQTNGSGTASWQTIVDANTNIYNTDGTLTGNRTVSMSTYTLSFSNDLLVNSLTIGKGNGNLFSNTAIGVSTLTSLSVGGNTAIGYSALSITTTQSNTAVGYNAMKLTTTGGYNSAFGQSALENQTTGTENTAIGYTALSFMTVGNYNTALGQRAGRNVSAGTNLTSADTSVFLGAYTRASADAQTNQIVIGYLAIGNGSNTAQIGNSSITNLKTFGTITAGVITYPNVDGTNGQYLQTNGSGTASWQTVSSANIYNSDGTLTGNRTVTMSTYTLSFSNDLLVNSLTIGTGGGNNSTNTAIGYQSLFSNGMGTQNTALGYQSLYSNNDRFAIGNTAIGYQALRTNTSGGNNTALGSSSLYANTTGSDNNSLGYNSLVSNTTGISNVAIGTSSLRTNTTGSYNTAVGSESLYTSNTGTSYNTAIGYRALFLTTTGANNVAIGYQALRTNTTGQYLTAVGQEALYSFNGLGASYNTAIGYRSSYAMTSGITNTSVGYNSLSSCTTANSNTAIGYNSLSTTTTGAGGNTAVGNFSLNSTTVGNSNTSIGNGASQANTTGSQNTSVGNSSSRFTTTATGNSVLGYQALYTNTTGGYNSVLGNQALYTNSTGANNVAIGFQSLYTSTTSSQIAIGYQSLRSNTTGTFNTAVGYQALYTNTTAVNNTAIGQESLYSNTTGDYNTALGNQSAKYNTTGTQNTAIGVSAMQNNSTGSYNVALGTSSLFTSQFGTFNTSLGYQSQYFYNNSMGVNTSVGSRALYSNGFGTSNTAIGYQSLYSNTSSYNTALGENSLYANTTGTYNTAIGWRSLTNSTTGNNNTSIGYSSLYNNTTGQDNISIGYNSLYSNNSGSQNISIGQSALYTTQYGYSNVAIGHQSQYFYNNSMGVNTSVGTYSLYSNGFGTSNTAIGYYSLYSNTSSYNTAVGEFSLQNNTTGGWNTANGYSSSKANTTGTYNVSLGYNSLYNNTTGSSNTAIGGSAGYYITGNGNIVIGTLDSSGNYYPVYDITTDNDVISMGTTSTNSAYIQVAWTVTSDKRDKTNFKSVPHGLDFVSKLKPTSYQFRKSRDSEETNGDVRYGFLAQDILELEGSDSVVIESKDSEKLRYNESSLIPILVNAIQELKAEIELLKSKI